MTPGIKKLKESHNVATTGVSLPYTLWQMIDKERGDVSRSRFVQRIIENALIKKKVIKKK